MHANWSLLQMEYIVVNVENGPIYGTYYQFNVLREYWTIL
jgi:hypothetical protein